MSDTHGETSDADGLMALLAQMPDSTALTEPQQAFLLELQASQRAAMGKREVRRRRVTVRVSDEELARLQDVARRQGVTVSTVMRRVLWRS
ncbi:MAG TPA: ribbon-helix-helix protein, CopG family [Candidatus Nanopelagicaceae bacterium]|nr:ribbon-helix-helix protein, CopG family [Candidatus Nanopelagicaceae bacterium]